MGKPKKFYISNKSGSSGVHVTWTRRTKKLSIGGWYNSVYGIESRTMTLLQFFNELGITKKDCEYEFNKNIYMLRENNEI